MKKKIAFFDFDGTLIKTDSFFRFAFFVKGKKKVIGVLIKIFPKIILSKLKILNRGKVKEQIFGMLYSGMNYETFLSYCNQFPAVLKKYENPTIINKLKKLQNQGVEINIVSASIYEWIKPWAYSHGIQSVISTEIEVEGEKHRFLSGRFSTLNCNREEKVKRILQHYPHLSEYEIWAYGDSRGDEEMLKIAQHSEKI